ncbi:WD40/YVTN/BNR-like repeat-containing protein [Haloarcula nitratireducens]|uniref:Glycosyl hydrolase n=1 Tax=Haloarcula nitratireducens TaxID=2487749 RepID=A0AAW4PFZ5_9EURY|nr:hypothetical protein [Halomicroarcula nitratireducens]MBX0296225.1 hypothetical protein [Halomicroarcula nitratireducens]
MNERARADGFVPFFRQYTKTWQHAVATAALTAFGTLTFINRLFAVVAISVYLLTPAVLYVLSSSSGREQSESNRRSSGADAESTEPDRERNPEPAGESDSPVESSDTEVTRESESSQEPEESQGPESPPAWTTATVPCEETLHDAAVADGTAYAVGSEGSVLADNGDGWSAVLSDGPGAQSNALRGVDAVEGGGVWVAGDSGAVGRLDPESGRHVDLSAPNDDTNNLAGVAVAGTPDDETVLLIDGSGRVRRGRYREGETAWEEPVTPGSGSSLASIALQDASVGYACDTNQCVFETDDGGRTFAQSGLGGADGTLTDVAADDDGCAVSDDSGVVHRYDGERWTPERPGEDALWALALDETLWLAAGDGGTVYERAADATDWERTPTPATASLRGVALGRERAIAVGAEGTVVERPRSETR